MLAAQTTLTNSDLVKLSKAGLSEDFILNLIDQQGSRLASDPSALVALKNEGVNERIISAAVKKSPSREPLNSDSVLRLVQAGFSDGFIINLLERAAGQVHGGRVADRGPEAGGRQRKDSGADGPAGRRTGTAQRQPDQRPADRFGGFGKKQRRRRIPGQPGRSHHLGNDVVVQKGADARVRLVAEQESGKLTGKAGLTVQLVSITVDGKTMPVNSSDVSEYSGSRGARTAKSAAAVGAVGAIIGAIAGGGKGAAIGAGAGAAAGAGAQTVMKGQQVRIPSETVLTFTTQKAVQLP